MAADRSPDAHLRRRTPGWAAVGPPLLLLVGFAVALLIRVLIGGPGVAQSAPAGLVFGVLLLVLTVAARTPVPVDWRGGLAGVAVAALLCLPVVVQRSGPLPSSDGYLRWAAVVGIVAVAEEVFLRGALYDAVDGCAGATAAVAVGATAFALLHVPLYGWQVVPLDLAVGVVLGELRRSTGSSFAPAVAHTVADWVAWFLR